jgi:hypothetical protein
MYKFRTARLSILVLLIISSIFLIKGLTLSESPFDRGTLEAGLHDDLINLSESGNLPTQFQEIKRVMILDHRPQKSKINWKKISQLHFTQNQAGKFDLNIDIFAPEIETANHRSSDDKLIFIQFSLMEMHTKNKIWELTRSYRY